MLEEYGSSTLTPIERARQRADMANRTPGKLEGADCPLCLNRGYFWRVDDEGTTWTEDCSCMAKRRSLRLIKASGLGELLSRYTLANWQAAEPWQAKIAKMITDFAAEPNGWVYISGRPGTGKTHLCTALCGELMDRGLAVRYLLWRDFSVRAKSLVGEAEEYRALLEPLKSVRVLYIDDLFKAGRGSPPTQADINLAFELINARYNDARLITIISSETSLKKLTEEIDEALGSRIYERSKGHCVDLAGRANWRLRND